MSDRIVTLDVREDILAGREPFTRIMQTVAGLEPKEVLVLIAPFEPVPLYRVLGRDGYLNEARQTAEGDWEVRFWRNPASDGLASTPPAPRKAASSCGCSRTADVEVDARGLEPPQPMVTILEALATLPEGAGLVARTDRRPMHLYAQLEERGFIGESTEENDGTFVTQIRRRDVSATAGSPHGN